MANLDHFTRKHAVTTDAGFDSSGLQGRSVVLTGGASGIGEASMRALVAAGAFVTFGDVAEERGVALESELGSEKVAFVKCDTGVWKDQLHLFKSALQKSPSKNIDVVIANAGTNGPDEVIRPRVDADTGDPVEPNLNIVQVNLIGVLYTCQLAVHFLPRQASGEGRDRCLLITGSLSGYGDHAAALQYSAGKYAVRGMFRSLRGPFAENGARVNIVAPWFIKSTNILSKEEKDGIDARGLRWASLDDAVTAVMHLASDTKINGRAFGVVPRGVRNNQQGYLDLQLDDFAEDDIITELRSATMVSDVRSEG